jgi:hypothetical protein
MLEDKFSRCRHCGLSCVFRSLVDILGYRISRTAQLRKNNGRSSPQSYIVFLDREKGINNDFKKDWIILVTKHRVSWKDLNPRVRQFSKKLIGVHHDYSIEIVHF